MLLLVRHGKAIPAEEWTGEDKDRPLNEKGIERTKTLAKGLRKFISELKKPVLYASPYVRTIETAKILGKEWDIKAEAQDLLVPGWRTVPLEWMEKNVIIVGHMPDLKEVLASLTQNRYIIEFQPPSLAALSIPAQEKNISKNDENSETTNPTSEELPRLIGYWTWKAFE